MFNKFEEMPLEGFELEILALLRKNEGYKKRDRGLTISCFEMEIRKLECLANNRSSRGPKRKCRKSN